MTTYYVNYATGSDTNSGTSPNSPWEHAPGDPNATGNVATTTLVGGDEVLFRAGVVYQGSINVPTGGTAANPIVYEGTGWGTGQAIMSGLTSVQVNFTAVPGQPGVSVATLPSGLTPSLANIVEIDGQVSYMSNNSTSANPYFPDLGAIPYNASEMSGAGSSWTFTDPTLAQTLSALTPTEVSNLTFRTYVAGNAQLNMNATGFNSETGALSLSGGFVAPTGLPLGPSYTLYNDPYFVSPSNPYSEYAVEGNQIYAAVTPGTHTVSVSTSPYAFRTTQSNVTIDGFNISGYGAPDGRGIEALYGPSNIQITNNTLSNLATHYGYGYSAIYANDVTNLTVSGNTIGPNIVNGAGLDLLNDTNVVASRNTISSVGWTGVVAFGDSNTSISYNQISNLYFVHGAGIIAYALSNGPTSQNVSITNNQIANAGTGIDFQGYNANGGPSSTPNNFTIADNVLTGITGWGIADYGETNTANIYGNIVLTTPQAYGPFAVQNSSVNVSYYDNIVSTFSYINPTLFTATNTQFWGNVGLSSYGPPPGTNTVDTALASVLTQALASPGTLPTSIGSILSPGSSTPIGIDWTTTAAPINSVHPGWGG